LSKGTLYIVAAPSGAGKSSLVKALVDALADITISISYTTRALRPRDESGVEYHFVSEKTFLDMVAKQQFLEHADVFGHHYGTSKDWVMATLHKGIDVILEIDWQGARQIRQLFPDAVSVYILPPSLAELEARLLKRKQDSQAVIQDRMSLAQDEMSHYHEFDYVVINDDFMEATAALTAIVKANRLKTANQVQNQQKLLAELTQSS